MRKRIQILGDQISDVYIDNSDIKQNQEIILSDSVKGKFNNMTIRAGGTGFVIVNLLKLIGTYVNIEQESEYVVKYLLPDFNFNTYKDTTCSAFNLHKLFDMSLKYLYNEFSHEYFHIIRMQPIDYLNDVIKPTVKIRFISKENKEVYYRFDNDNDVQMRNINCSHLFEKTVENNLVLIDYNKGYLNKSTIRSLMDYITTNNISFRHMFLNTKPDNITNFKEILGVFKRLGTKVHIQLNEFEYEPIKDVLDGDDYYWSTIIVTRGTKSILLKESGKVDDEIDISGTLVDDVYTTSGCGDLMLSGIIYAILYKNVDIKSAIEFSISKMKESIVNLNIDLFD